MNSSPSPFWETSPTPVRVIAEPTLSEWEGRTGLKIPPFLRQALLVQDGGQIANTISPKTHVLSVDKWESFEEPELLEEVEIEGEAERLIKFGESDDGENFYLNYNECASDGEPQVLSLFYDLGRDPRRETLAEMLARVTRAGSEPVIDETFIESLTVISETCMDAGPCQQRQWIGRNAGAELILVEHFHSDKTETWSAQTLPEPLYRKRAVIKGRPWYGKETFELRLEPQNNKGTVYKSAEKLPSGKWKNRVSSGVSGTLLDADSGKLEKVRSAIFGESETAAEANDSGNAGIVRTADRLRAEYEARAGALSETEKQIAEIYLAALQAGVAAEDLEGSQDNAADLDMSSISELGGMQMMLMSVKRMLAAMGGLASLSQEMRTLMQNMVEAEKKAGELED